MKKQDTCESHALWVGHISREVIHSVSYGHNVMLDLLFPSLAGNTILTKTGQTTSD